jgi:hypothetical protein
MNSANYINSIVFDHVETYSFNRGTENEPAEAEYARLNSINNTEERNAAFRELQHKYFVIVNEDGQFHPYSKKTGTFKNDHPLVDRVKQILRTEIEHQMKLLCAPEYRDAFVFYDHNHQIISTLNICFSCMYMHTIPHQEIKADYKTYDWLKRIFLEIGHNVENPEYSVIADIENQKQRIRKK